MRDSILRAGLKRKSSAPCWLFLIIRNEERKKGEWGSWGSPRKQDFQKEGVKNHSHHCREDTQAQGPGFAIFHSWFCKELYQQSRTGNQIVWTEGKINEGMKVESVDILLKCGETLIGRAIGWRSRLIKKLKRKSDVFIKSQKEKLYRNTTAICIICSTQKAFFVEGLTGLIHDWLSSPVREIRNQGLFFFLNPGFKLQNYKTPGR